MNESVQQIEQFLSYEKEILTNLALDVANARETIDYHKAKTRYDIQYARVEGIQESLNLVINTNLNRVASF